YQQGVETSQQQLTSSPLWLHNEYHTHPAEDRQISSSTSDNLGLEKCWASSNHLVLRYTIPGTASLLAGRTASPTSLLEA
ncbi:hypothetical protein Hamer_G028069, partial [Homarus americanus]